jgi:hypothetical protein
MLVALTDPSARGCQLNPIFMPCGAPKAHEVFHEKAGECLFIVPIEPSRLSIRASYSWVRSFNDWISLSSGSMTSRNCAFNPAASSRLTCCVPHLPQSLAIRLHQPALRSPGPFEHSPVRLAPGIAVR